MIIDPVFFPSTTCHSPTQYGDQLTPYNHDTPRSLPLEWGCCKKLHTVRLRFVRLGWKLPIVTNTLAYYGTELKRPLGFMIKTLRSVCWLTFFANKLEHLSFSSPSSLVECLQARLVPTRVKYLSGSPL